MLRQTRDRVYGEIDRANGIVMIVATWGLRKAKGTKLERRIQVDERRRAVPLELCRPVVGAESTVPQMSVGARR